MRGNLPVKPYSPDSISLHPGYIYFVNHLIDRFNQSLDEAEGEVL